MTAFEWFCRCGARYRVADDGEEATFWAAVGQRAFSSKPTTSCVRCSRPLTRVRLSSVRVTTVSDGTTFTGTAPRPD